MDSYVYTGSHESNLVPILIKEKLKDIFKRTLIPLFLIISTPNLVIVLWYTAVHCDGSFAKMANVFQSRSVIDGLFYIWSHVHTDTYFSRRVIAVYSVYALIMMKLLPGRLVTGPLTAKGHVPIYRDNGFLYFLVTLTSFWTGSYYLRLYGLTPTVIYDRFDEFLFCLNAFSFLLCIFLYLKGLTFPSTADSGTTGNIIFDFYWGTELYPRILGFDVKIFTNCRFGMMVWALLVCIFAQKSFELHGFVDSMFVVTILQITYIAKFFWWEAGYMRTIDIMLDRAGYYICWGCLVFIPGLYTSTSLYMVKHPVHLGSTLSAVILFIGLLAVYINYSADDQKLIVRNTNGQCLIWGREPDIIKAKYRLDNGEVREGILLASGFWGLARHFHYLPELVTALCWSLPALFENAMPYTYFIWLFILLVHRSYRDDEKCRRKYGIFWIEYTEKVPYRIFPYVF